MSPTRLLRLPLRFPLTLSLGVSLLLAALAASGRFPDDGPVWWIAVAPAWVLSVLVSGIGEMLVRVFGYPLPAFVWPLLLLAVLPFVMVDYLLWRLIRGRRAKGTTAR
jgi:hypothetical protein